MSNSLQLLGTHSILTDEDITPKLKEGVTGICLHPPQLSCHSLRAPAGMKRIWYDVGGDIGAEAGPVLVRQSPKLSLAEGPSST
jgi:hypothetical protein